MNKWLVILICSIAGFFLLGGIGAFAVVSSTQGEVLVTGDASESITFRGEWDKFYDIYAEDQDVEIFFETSQTHDPDYTYLLRCGIDTGSSIGISGDCGDQRGDLYLVGDFTVEASGVGDVTLTFDGTGEVMIVESGVGGAFGSLALMCLGCCFCPVLIIVSGVKLGRGKTQNVVIIGGNQFGYQQPFSQQPTQEYTFNTVGEVQNYPQSPPSQQKDFSTWDSPSIATNNPPADLSPTQIRGGYEWIEHNGSMYYRAEASNGDWTKFNG
jgi:hypothetical protein